MTQEEEARTRDMWENTKMTARQIGLIMGVTHNAVIGMASRRDWNKRSGKPSATGGLYRRMDALHVALDLVLAEYEPTASHYVMSKRGLEHAC